MNSAQLNLTSALLSPAHQTRAMVDRIAKYLERRSGVTCVEMARDIPGFAGDGTWGHGEQNILLWADMSPAAIAAMGRLVAEERIVPTPTSWLVYNFDGGMLDMPIATDIKKRYAKPHWFPLVFAGNREVAQ